MGKLVVIDHPLVQHKLTLLRDKTTGTKEFRALVEELATLLAYEATRDLQLEDATVETPVATAHTKVLAGKKLAIVPILRAGLGMVDGMMNLIPAAKVGHIGLYRDPETLLPVDYYCKLPSDISERDIIIVDPMLATGGSANAGIDVVKRAGGKNVKLVNLIAAPEGIEAVQKAHPDVDIFVAHVDDHLNDHGYIVPGLGDARKPPRDEDDAPRKAKGRKSGKKGGSGKGGNGKKKKKIRWWQILLITLLVIALIFGGAFALIMGAITPAGGNIKLNQLINTPKEFQGKEFNILVTGVDRSSTGDLSAGAANDSNVNDGMTDMILYVHFNNETGEMKMLQIPRDTMVTTDASVSGNFRINGVAKTQGSDSNNNMAALCELVADQYKLPIDGFITIRLEMLTELVDLFGGVEINVPMDVDYAALGLGDSVIHAGYQTLNGASMEFLLRARKIYPDGDIGRLNMQRQFYAALFRKLKSIGNIWDVAKLTPAVLNYMETNLSASDLISFAISMLKIDSSKIMICQMPVISGPQYNGQSLLYPARQADADLLNQYFRENTGPVDASQLNLCDNVIDLSGYTATDPNIQQMGGLMAEADDAQKDPNQNLDGSNQVTDIMASESTAESESTDTDSTDTESQPAA